MSQTKSGSLQEALTSTGSAIVLSLLSYQFLLGPLLDLEVTYADNLVLTGYFTVLSFARIYVIRRVTIWRRHRREKKDAQV